MNDYQIMVLMVCIGIFVSVCTLIGALEKMALSSLYKRTYWDHIFRLKDETDENLAATYVEAKLKEWDRTAYCDDLEGDSVEVEALIDSIEEIASSRGLKLPTDDEIRYQCEEEQ